MKICKKIALGLFILLIFSLVACRGRTDTASGRARSEELRVSWWGAQARHNATIEALDKYAEDNTVSFSYEYTSWDSYFENLATQSVGNNMPDLVQMSMDNIIQYTQNGLIIDMSPYIADGTIQTNGVDSGNLDAGKVDGKLTGYITGVNSISVFYNKEIFDRAGVAYPSDNWTWSEYLDTARRIYRATGIQTEIPFLMECRWFLEHLVRSYGYNYYDINRWSSDNRVIAGIVKVFGDIQAMIAEGVFVNPEVQITWAAPNDYYIVQGRSAIHYNLTNAYGNYSNLFGGELGLAIIPQPDDAVQTGMYLNANMYWSISRDSRNPAAVARVLNYLVNNPDGARVISTDRGISINSNIRDMLRAESDIYVANMLSYINTISNLGAVTNLPDPVGSAEAMIVLRTNYQALVYNEMTPLEFINNYVARARVLINP